MRRLALLSNRPPCYSISMNHTSRARLAVLGTMSELYLELVAVKCQRLHCLVPRLRSQAGEIQIVNYQEL
jgi:hypothetical protein